MIVQPSSPRATQARACVRTYVHTQAHTQRHVHSVVNFEKSPSSGHLYTTRGTGCLWMADVGRLPHSGYTLGFPSGRGGRGNEEVSFSQIVKGFCGWTEDFVLSLIAM